MDLFLFILLLIWTLIWKGIALWKAARLGEKKWFIALFILNTVGVLEILYIYYFSEKKNKRIAEEKEPKADDKVDDNLENK